MSLSWDFLFIPVFEVKVRGEVRGGILAGVLKIMVEQNKVYCDEGDEETTEQDVNGEGPDAHDADDVVEEQEVGGWHQDFFIVPLDPESLVFAVIPGDECKEDQRKSQG